MIQQRLRKVGNSYVVTIPKDEVKRRNLQPGQLVSVEIHALDVRPALDPDVAAAFEESWQLGEAAYRYLGEN